MGLFSSKKEGGLMDVIRCDEEQDYLIWKWSPTGEHGTTRKENAIRYGSSLRVKDGELAVFVYKQADGGMQDFIEGPFDRTIKTENFPVLAGIVGAAFGGASPFQAEIYFINLALNLQLDYAFNVKLRDPRVKASNIPALVKCSIIFRISDYREFIKLNRMRHFTMSDLKAQAKQAIESMVTSSVAGIVAQSGLAVDNIDSLKDPMSKAIRTNLAEELRNVYGLDLRGFYITELFADEDSPEYQAIATLIDEQSSNVAIENMAYRQNVVDQQAVNMEHMAETLRVQREEAQRAQRLQTESANLSAHQLNIQGAVGLTAAESLGQLGSNPGSGFGGGEGGGMNPAAMMTGMMVGGTVGSGMSNMMGNMMQGMNNPQPPQPPAGATAQYHISVNGGQAGPYTMAQLGQMAASGQFTRQTHVWRAGMGAWDIAGNVPELAAVFGAVPPPPPAGGPPTPPPPPANM